MEPEKIDQWLEQALGEYSRVEPRHGLEYRVLSSWKAEESRRAGRRRWRLAAAFIASVAVIAMWLGVPHLWRRPAIPEHTLSSSATQLSESPQIQKELLRESSKQASAKGAAHASRRKQVSTLVSINRKGTPKLDRFPSAHPLSEQEKLLIAYVKQAREPVADPQLGNGHIEQIDIPPLQISSSFLPSLDEH
jgi:hypothetical protein